MDQDSTSRATPYLVRRLADEPIISARIFPGPAGADNINGPSLIAAPQWLPNPLGRFYLYFAHHHGKSIRLACADRLEGPWRLAGPSLKLSDAKACSGHIASPDVHVDDERREIRMYFHGVVGHLSDQKTFLARSGDGIHFTAGNTPLADFYLRVIVWRDRLVGVAKAGAMYLSEPGQQHLHALPQIAFPPQRGRTGGGVRHVALRLRGDLLEVFHTRVGDAPECILLSTIDLSRPVQEWQATVPEPVMLPGLAWEGADLPIGPSRPGRAVRPENALRDPAIFEWLGRCYMLYAGAGEQAIGIAELLEDPAPG